MAKAKATTINGGAKKAPAKSKPKGHPGGFLFHCYELIEAARAGDARKAGTIALELFRMVLADLDNFPPVVYGAPAGEAGEDLPALAGRVEQIVKENEPQMKTRGKALPKGVDAGVWTTLIPILIEILLSALRRR